MMSLPRVLTLDQNHDLRLQVAPAVEKLRQREQVFRPAGNGEQDRAQIARRRIENCCGEVVCSFRRGMEPFVVSLVSETADAKPWLTIRYDPSEPNFLTVDERSVPLDGVGRGEIEIQGYIDRSVIETIVNRRSAYTKRLYHSGSSAPPIAMQVEGRTESLSLLSLWQMTPTSADRLTT